MCKLSMQREAKKEQVKSDGSHEITKMLIPVQIAMVNSVVNGVPLGY